MHIAPIRRRATRALLATLLLNACSSGGPTSPSRPSEPTTPPTPPAPSAPGPTAIQAGTYPLGSLRVVGAAGPCLVMSSPGCPLMPAVGAVPIVVASGSLILRANGAASLAIAGSVGSQARTIVALAGTYRLLPSTIGLTLLPGGGTLYPEIGAGGRRVTFSLPADLFGALPLIGPIELVFERP